MLKRVIIVTLVMTLSMKSYSQCALPEQFILETSEDYKEQEVTVLKLMDCLVRKPDELSSTEKEQASAYCLIWLCGTPDYEIHLNTKTAVFKEELPELLYIYMFALMLTEKDFPSYSQEEKEAEALYLVSLHYQSLKKCAKCKALIKVAKKYESGKLVDYLRELKAS